MDLTVYIVKNVHKSVNARAILDLALAQVARLGEINIDEEGRQRMLKKIPAAMEDLGQNRKLFFHRFGPPGNAQTEGFNEMFLAIIKKVGVDVGLPLGFKLIMDSFKKKKEEKK